MNKRYIWIIIALAVASIAAYAAWRVTNQEAAKPPIADIINLYPKQDSSNVDTSHLSDKLIPPTNKWFSGFALQRDPKPGFAYPLSVKPTKSSLEIGLPQTSVSSSAIIAPHIASVTVTIKDADRYLVTRYDSLTVDLMYFQKDTKLATITVAQGSPYVFINSHKDDVIVANIDEETKINNAWYSIETNDKLTTVYAAQNQNDLQTLSKYAGTAITGSEVTYKTNGENIETTLKYHTKDNQPSIIGTLPHHSTKQPKSKPTYQSVLGEIDTITDTKLQYTTPKIDTIKNLDIQSISSAEKQIVKDQLTVDANNIDLSSPDTYFGGKQLQRTAMLLQLAKQLDEERIFDQILGKLTLAFNNWLDPGSDYGFYYDSRLHTIVGKQAGFGANEANDHHFHYGYFIYTASILAKYDETFVDRHGEVIRLLTADIADTDSSNGIVDLRVYDSYAGHSWASGTVPFADGNNQESSSEAINAWVGVNLWADVTNDTQLTETSSWLLANEVASTNQYYLKGQKGYDHKSFGIVWGGKRAWETWFSPEPNAIVGIQLLPATPTMMQLYTSNQANIKDVTSQPGLSTRQKFGDYILMAQATYKPITIKQAQELPDEAIDDGNSRSYLYAWIASASAKR